MNISTLVCSVALLALVANVQTAEARQNVKVGALRCDVSGGLGLVIASKKTMDCKFTSVKGRSERYSGTISKFGIDIGATNGGILAWDVFAPTAGPKRKALAGKYAGVDASVAVGIGLGVNVLVGGSKRSFTLQPLSAEVESGIALAAGVESLELSAAKK
ncbi:MAG: DUF992 domain-containing protein [Micavibrio sp.]|nr:DUF992 domain-containing protein [Micavibrio sp.]